MKGERERKKKEGDAELVDVSNSLSTKRDILVFLCTYI